MARRRWHRRPALNLGTLSRGPVKVDTGTIVSESVTGYSPRVRFEKAFVEQCRATKAIKRRFGAKSALDYLIGEKLIAFADAARDHAGFARELPRFLAAIWQTFNEYEIAGYIASQKPAARNRLRQLMYLR
jgi:hypothetical protein